MDNVREGEIKSSDPGRDNTNPTDDALASVRGRRGTLTPARRRLFLLIAFAMVFCTTLVSAEIVLRLYVSARGWTTNCYAAHLHFFRPHPELGYDLTPNFRLRSGTISVSTNALGLRGPEILPRSVRSGLAGSTSRIAILGESAAFGYLVRDGQEAARLVENLYRGHQHHVEVINAGVPGYNLYQIPTRYKTLVAPLQPDVVVLYLGWNDLAYVVSESPEARSFRVRPVASAWQRLFAYSVLYGFVHHRLLGAPARMAPANLHQVVPTPEGAARFRQNLTELIHAIRADGIRVILCMPACAAHPHVTPGLRALLNQDDSLRQGTERLGEWLHVTLREMAQRENVEFLDAYQAIAPTEAHLADYIHLTSAGEQALAQLLYQHIGWPLDKSKISRATIVP